MEQVQGIGGVFLYARDAAALAGWYRERLGIPLEPCGEEAFMFEFPSADRVPGPRTASTVFAIFAAEGPLPAERTARVNYRVADLDATLARLAAAGVETEERSEDYGRFAWVRDPEGNRVELWEPSLRA